MHEHGLAKEIWPQLEQLAKEKGFKKVTLVEMTVGMLHGVSADFLAHSLEHAYEGTGFEGARTHIQIVEPGDALTGQEEATVATGWELMITRIEGQK